MKTYNVLVGVVDLVAAENESDAIRILEKRLQEAGFETIECGEVPHAFESEDVSYLGL